MVTQIINTEAKVKDYGSEIGIELPIDSSIASVLYINLAILHEDLLETVGLKFQNIQIFLKKSQNTASTVQTFVPGKGILKASISTNMLEYAMRYLLLYCRDGIGEAEHIDLDFEFNDVEVTITVKAKNHIIHSGEAIRNMFDD
jgi:hypothetical protein